MLARQEKKRKSLVDFYVRFVHSRNEINCEECNKRNNKKSHEHLAHIASSFRHHHHHHRNTTPINIAHLVSKAANIATRRRATFPAFTVWYAAVDVSRVLNRIVFFAVGS